MRMPDGGCGHPRPFESAMRVVMRVVDKGNAGPLLHRSHMHTVELRWIDYAILLAYTPGFFLASVSRSGVT